MEIREGQRKEGGGGGGKVARKGEGREGMLVTSETHNEYGNCLLCENPFTVALTGLTWALAM